MKQIVLFVSCVVFFSALHIDAAEPNYVRSTIFNVDGAATPSNIITTEYSDGLGRSLQSKQQLSAGKARVVSTFYDEAGRPYLTTKPFIDKSTNLNTLFTPGDFTEINGTLNNSDNYDDFLVSGSAYAYSEMNYYDDPLGRVKRAGAPGADYRLESDHFTASWSFGVKNAGTETFTVDVSNIDVTVTIVDGFITVPDPLTVEVLDALYDHLLVSPLDDADHFLTVARDPDDKYTMELKDLFGRTVATRAGTTANPIFAGYSHDILGNLLTEIAPKQGTITLIGDSRYQYNTLGQLINKTTPDGGTFGYEYTPTGQLATDTSYTGTIIYRIRRYNYDDLDRLISTELKDNNDPDNDEWTVVASSYYDNFDDLDRDIPSYVIPRWLFSSLENLHGRLVASVIINRINGISYYVCDLYSYDDEGRIGKKFKIVPGLLLQEIFYTYDIHGKIVKDSTVCAAQVVVKEYQYDLEGRLIHIVHSNNGTTGKTVASYNYDDLGHTTDKTLGIVAGHKIDYKYNIRDWVTSIKPLTGNSYANRFSDSIVEYQANGNILNALYKYEGNSGLTEETYNLTYTYDEVNRLTGVAQAVGTGFTANYTYDEAGRFKSKEEGSVVRPEYKYYTANSRLKNTSGSDSTNYLYDKHGNLVVDKNKNMVIEYDWRDMPVAFRFYSAIPTTIGEASGTGQFQIALSEGETDLYRYMARKVTDGLTLLSQVVMCYDASGNRVLKMESK
jgi:YD repeat-containing protein